LNISNSLILERLLVGFTEFLEYSRLKVRFGVQFTQVLCIFIHLDKTCVHQKARKFNVVYFMHKDSSRW